MKFLNAILTAATPETAEAATETVKLTFEPSKFIDMLPYMGKGMLVIFVLIAVIILVTVLTNKIFSKK